jgi:DnaK suppressor protein
VHHNEQANDEAMLVTKRPELASKLQIEMAYGNRMQGLLHNNLLMDSSRFTFPRRLLMSNHSELKATLEKKLAELIERAGGIETQLSEPGERDWEENAIAKENDEALVALGNATETEIAEIRRALNRIDLGEFGVCMRCQAPIPQARLQAIPWATTCVKCA